MAVMDSAGPVKIDASRDRDSHVRPVITKMRHRVDI
jgi:hypothetical protein